ncbi:MAG TPA: CRISPR-associated protein Csx11, partial [Fusobacterium sp.]|nr:CRISPR-associated protein Csx11 [Fusobacterium sp.]
MRGLGKMLNLKNLVDYKDEILKAEIFSYFALYKKIKAGGGPNKVNQAEIFENLKNITDFDTKKYLEDMTKDIKINILEKDLKAWNNFLENPREWRKRTDIVYLLQVLYGISESLNSGIDKGSPNKEAKVEPKDKKWISNAFGGYKKEIIYLSNSPYEIKYLIENIENKFNMIDFNNISFENYYNFRNALYSLFSNLLSDDRYPINDITLWDQAYMSTSMFKASLANYILTNDQINSLPERTSVKWRILGIQYDKLGLAEKGFKPAHIDWYRNISKEIDDEIKKILELKYPIGNEVYRDETGIYFIVGEDLGKDLEDNKSNLAILKDDLKEIKEEILQIFEKKSLDEFYPAIFLTKASRGLMNLTYLLESARENFLKADWSKKESDIRLENSESERAKGICQICKQRLVFESDKRDEDKNVCETCYKEKTKGRVDKWVENTADKTIWTAELKDKNDRLALVVMKFELMDWLNGDLLSSMLIRKEDFFTKNSVIMSLINKYKELSDTGLNLLVKEIKNNNYKDIIEKFIDLFDEGIQEILKDILDGLKKLSTVLTQDKDELKSTFWESIDLILSSINKNKNDWINALQEFANGEEIKFKNNKITNFQKFKENQDFVNFIKLSFAFGFTMMQIYNVLFERSIGDRWEKFIYKALGDWDEQNKKPLKNKIDFENRKINWEKLDEKDIDFLATILLQFLLRKNPSPARIRRIWESTQEFFKEIEEKLLDVANIPNSRRIRLYWEWKNEDINYEGEAVYNNLEFWIEKKKCYLITYDPELIEKKLKGENKELTLKLENDETVNLKLQDAKTEYYKPYMSIIDPTPISWQFIIPAEYVQNLIKNTQTLYDEYFKYVYGKLPLHIGVIIQDYKQPLYVGINALRKIRRDVKGREKLWEKIEVKDFKKIFNDKLKEEKTEEKENQDKNNSNNPKEYYSLY